MEQKSKFEIPTKEKLWGFVVEKGREIESGYQANKFDKDDVTTIIATMEFFNVTDVWLKQTYYDLTIPKYRLFDWLGMCVMSRNDDDRKQNENALKVLVYSWLKVGGNPKLFIADLRESDYDVDESWKKVEVISSGNSGEVYDWSEK